MLTYANAQIVSSPYNTSDPTTLIMTDGHQRIRIDVTLGCLVSDHLRILLEHHFFHGWLREMDGGHDEVERADHDRYLGALLIVCEYGITSITSSVPTIVSSKSK